MRNSVKILVIGQLPPVINGQSLVTKSILDVLIKENYHVDFLPLTSLNHSNSILMRLKKFGFYIKSFLEFIRLTYSGNYIVYLNGARSIGGTFRNYPFLIFSIVFGNKTVLHFHCGDIDEFLESQNLVVRVLLKHVYRLPDKIIILSSLLRNNFRQIEYRNNIVVIKNAVDIIGKPKKLSASESIRIIYMSNLILSKGYFDVLTAVNHLVNDLGLKNITCDFCGEFLTSFDDPKSNSIESMKSDFFEFILKNNLSSHVNYYNLVLDQQKLDLMAKSHFFILPTNYSTEAQPLSIIEAIASGCVIISTNYRAIPDMVIDNFNGRFVEFGNSLSIAQNILYFVGNPSVYESSSTNSVLHYQKYFTIDNFNNKVVELFEQIRN